MVSPLLVGSTPIDHNRLEEAPIGLSSAKGCLKCGFHQWINTTRLEDQGWEKNSVKKRLIPIRSIWEPKSPLATSDNPRPIMITDVRDDYVMFIVEGERGSGKKLISNLLMFWYLSSERSYVYFQPHPEDNENE